MKKFITVFIILLLTLFFNLQAQSYNWEDLGIISSNIMDIEITSNGYIFTAIYGGDFVVKRSTDNGQTWEGVLQAGNGTDKAERIRKDENDNIYACHSFYGVFKSTDYGENWYSLTENFNENTFFYDIICLSSESYIMTCSQGTFISTNGGFDWSGVNSMNKNDSYIPRYFEKLSNDILFEYWSYWGGGVNRSTDNGNTWEYIDSLGQCSSMTHLDDIAFVSIDLFYNLN